MITVPILRGFTEISKIYELTVRFPETYIVGGYARYMCSPRQDPAKATDVDVGCTAKGSYHDVIAAIHKTNLFDEQSHQSKVGPPSKLFFPKNCTGNPFVSCPPVNVIDYSGMALDSWAVIVEGMKPTSLEDVLKSFDYTVCMVGMLNKDTCIAHDSFIKDETEKRLKVSQIVFPEKAVRRLAKYINMGYTVSNKEMYKLFKSIHEIVEKDKDQKTLEERLNNTGAS